MPAEVEVAEDVGDHGSELEERLRGERPRLPGRGAWHVDDLVQRPARHHLPARRRTREARGGGAGWTGWRRVVRHRAGAQRGAAAATATPLKLSAGARLGNVSS